MVKVVQTERAPAALGPYSQAVVAGGFAWCSGQIPLDPATGALVGADAAAQARQAIGNLSQVLTAAGTGLDRVVKTTVYLADLADFAAVNAVYAELFGAAKPARSCVRAAGLPKGAKIEIDAVAAMP